jgi:hypothetical protein
MSRSRSSPCSHRHGDSRDLQVRRWPMAHACRGGAGRRQLDRDGNRPTGDGSASRKDVKSKRNVIDPDDIIEKYGADTARWFMLSDTPPERDIEWTEAGVLGAWRFVQRIWRLSGEVADFNVVHWIQKHWPHASTSRCFHCAGLHMQRSQPLVMTFPTCASIGPSPHL